MSVALNRSLSTPATSPWVVALAVVIPTFMEVLDTTIANVALRYMAGGLSAPASDSEWVITSYLAANAIILPISGWLGQRLGRRNYFLLSIAIFTLASALCGMAWSLWSLVGFRVLQGLAGGGLQPSSQGILLDAFPAEKQGQAMTLFAVAALLAPVVGPTLGGYITDNYGWRWIFLLNVPVGLAALTICHAVVRDPAYIGEAREKLKRSGQRFDLLGLALLCATMVSWEILLSKGQEWDWFGDPFWRIQTLATVFVGCLGGLIWRELRIVNPLINFRTLKDPTFRSCCIIIFCAYGVLYANTTTLPGLLQTLFGYDATRSGLVLSPAGIFAVMTLLVVGASLGRGVDARKLMGLGLIVMGVGNWMMSQWTLEVAPYNIIVARIVVIVGLSMIFAPLNVSAFRQIPPAIRGSAVGLLALLRNEGGSVGTSVAQTVHDRREQFHTLRINESLDALSLKTQAFLQQSANAFASWMDPVAARQAALGGLARLRDAQASSLAYFDVFFALAVVSGLLVLLLPTIKRVTVEKGEHVAAE